MASHFGRVATLTLALFTASVATVACRHPARHKMQTVWRAVGSWSGRGDAQTDSFDIGYSDVRIRWETNNEKPAGEGTFRAAVCSAVSGRELVTAVNQKGAGHNIAYVSVDPHWSYLLINSKNLDWSVTVEELTTIEAP
ncbi:MAG TPA: hypothetical protein VMH05_06245 [Bryobacteraceae bacterium]|nr:hypothetical protein [Bryobacteraceae bacterium]